MMPQYEVCERFFDMGSHCWLTIMAQLEPMTIKDEKNE